MDGEEDARVARVSKLLGKELIECRATHHGGVEDLACEHVGALLEDCDLAAGIDVLDAHAAGMIDRDRALGLAEVPGGHGRDVRAGVA